MTSQLEKLSELVDDFCDKRDWKQFHNIKDLAIGLSIEASELLQIFLWKDSDEVQATLENPSKRENIEDEVADVLFFRNYSDPLTKGSLGAGNPARLWRITSAK